MNTVTILSLRLIAFHFTVADDFKVYLTISCSNVMFRSSKSLLQNFSGTFLFSGRNDLGRSSPSSSSSFWSSSSSPLSCLEIHKGGIIFKKGRGALYLWSAIANFFWPPLARAKFFWAPLSVHEKNCGPPPLPSQKNSAPPHWTSRHPWGRLEWGPAWVQGQIQWLGGGYNEGLRGSRVKSSDLGAARMRACVGPGSNPVAWGRLEWGPAWVQGQIHRSERGLHQIKSKCRSRIICWMYGDSNKPTFSNTQDWKASDTVSGVVHS